MIVTHLNVKNWRNFRSVDVDLRERQFIVGPNASGKSNFLDVFRFLRDIAKTEGGGLQKAIKDRGGIPKVRSLAARKDPEISIEVSLAEVLASRSPGDTRWESGRTPVGGGCRSSRMSAFGVGSCRFSTGRR